MTDQEMIIAIAEACGAEPSVEKTIPHRKIWRFPGFDCNLTAGDLPLYTSDLNAIHAAEAGLTGHEMRRYQAILFDIADKHPDLACWGAIHATAHQRAKSFLKTIGKWQE